MKYFLSIVAIFKNESDNIVEWLNHYLAEGVDHFYLIDNGSTDNYQKLIKPFIDEKLIDLKVDGRRHMQKEHYNSYITAVKQDTEWVMVVDLDEFIYSRLQFKTISDYLKTIPDNTSQIYVPWKLFGSNGQLFKNNKNLIDTFTMRTLYNNTKTNGMIDTERINCKTLIRTKYLMDMDIHASNVNNQTVEITSDNQPKCAQNKAFQKINEDILTKSALHCNHYPIQSFEWFKQVKMPRGSANSVGADTIRTIDYYNSFDSHSNQKLDDELKNKRNKLIIWYGNDKYIDVTRRVIKNFMSVDGTQIVINDNVDFNKYFGDPVLGIAKYLVIRQNNSLKVSPEHKHGKITITKIK